MLHRIRTRLGTALAAGPLALSAAVPVALAVGGPSPELEHVGLLSQALGPGDGLERYVVTVGRDLPPVSDSGWRQPSSSSAPTFDENLTALSRFPGVEIVQPLGGNRALVAVQEGTSARVLPFVRSAEVAPTGTWAGVAPPDDPYFDYTWALRNTARHPFPSPQLAGADVQALTAWEHSRGEGVVVAVVDNGFDSAHPDLADSLWTNPDEGCDPTVDRDRNGLRGDCHGWNFYRNSPDVANVVDGRSMASHGTPVAGMIAAGVGNGIGTAGLAPQAKIMPVVIGGGSELQTLHIAPAIRYAVDNGADIINMSFGVNGDVPQIRDAIAYAASRGVLMVAAAGNSGGLNRDVSRSWPVSYSFPELMGVGSSNAADGVAAHSDVGPTTVHLFAPGQDLVAAFPGNEYRWANGTSFASPLTAAAAALVMAARPDMSAVAVKEHLVRTVDKLPGMAGRSVSGGRLDAGRALSTLATPAQVSVDGLAGLRAKSAGTATVRVTGSGAGLPTGALALEVSLAAYKDGRVLAVADHLLDAGTAGAGRTGQDGSLLLRPAGLTAAAIASGVAVPLTTTLPQGRYGLVTQLLSSTGAPVTPPQAVAFTIAPRSADGGGAPGGSDGGSGGGSTQPAPGADDAPTGGGTGPGTGTGGGGTDPGTDDGRTGDGGTGDGGTGDGGTGEGGTGPGTPGGDTDPGAGSGGGSGGGADGDRSGGDGPPGQPAPDVDGGEPGGVPGVGDAPTPGGGGPGGGSGQVPAQDRPAGDAPRGDAPSGGGAPRACADGSVPASAHFGITSLTPACGGLSGGDTVTIRGARLPAAPSVLIGGQPARVLSGTSTSITVSTPRRYNAGTFDVQVFSLTRVSDVLAGAFTYHDDQQSAPETPSGEDGSSGGDGGAGGDGSVAPSSPPATDSGDFEGLTLVDTGGDVGGLTAASMALLGNCGTSCFATKL